MLRPQYTRRPFELMLIGPSHSGKQTLATQLLKCRNVFFQINTASKIPKKDLPRVDYTLLIVDLTNRGCLDLLEEILSRIKPSYITHQFAIVVSKVDVPEQWAITKQEIEALVLPFAGMQIFYANLQNQSERKAITEQITRLIQMNTFQFQNLDIDYVKSHEFYRIESCDPPLQ